MKYNLNYCGHSYVTLEVEANSLEEAEQLAEKQLTEDQTSEALDKIEHKTYWNFNYITWEEGHRRHSVSYLHEDDADELENDDDEAEVAE